MVVRAAAGRVGWAWCDEDGPGLARRREGGPVGGLEAGGVPGATWGRDGERARGGLARTLGDMGAHGSRRTMNYLALQKDTR